MLADMSYGLDEETGPTVEQDINKLTGKKMKGFPFPFELASNQCRDEVTTKVA